MLSNSQPDLFHNVPIVFAMSSVRCAPRHEATIRFLNNALCFRSFIYHLELCSIDYQLC